MAEAVKHEYHLVEPSRWPILGATGAFLMAFGGIFWMHDYSFAPYVFWLGVLVVGYTMISWWRDVVVEARSGWHTPTVQIGLRYGMILFIISEVMFFVAWFWAYFNASLDPVAQEGGQWLFRGVYEPNGVWPPEGIKTFDPWHLPFVNTLILLLSGTTVTWAHHSLIEGNRKAVKQGLWLTIALGLLFTSLQAYEYTHAGFPFAGNIYGATFFMATGFHGFHVIVGTIFLSVCLYRVYLGHFQPDHHFGFEAAAWYWHFVDVVWLFLFSAIYWWGGAA